MSIEGEFILLAVADAFLASDYEYSLRISSSDFSSTCNSDIFESNILRYRALASIKLFMCAIEEKMMVQNFAMLA